jgi:hypothetical protein
MAIYIHEMVQDARAAPRRGRNRPDGAFAAEIDDVVAGQKLDEMFRHANRADARSAAAVRDAKGLVQIQMADVRADEAGAGEADLRVHVRAVHVNLAAVRVDDFANLADGFLEHAVRAGIGDHQAREIGLVRLGLRLEVGDVDVAVGVARDGDDFHAGHDGAGGVRAVREVGMRHTLRCASPRDS